ncbi:hypothetical protein [Clostridium folliculivorans]|uniref:hypothetical protein n=1 Tax=Clostridium folliculivorans TaxID=2886038 RepID=UPI0021C2BDCF|nr:hypothetical protein [Clostridium folliculivorans]GKU29303.1 hypothetical protein CFB3_14090 [Clostridium folliculivorans]
MMDNKEIYKMFYKAMINGFIEVFKVLWTVDEFKSAVIGVPISFITFRIVGTIFKWGRSNEIWFGRLGGKILYYLINTFLIWIVMKIV